MAKGKRKAPVAKTTKLNPKKHGRIAAMASQMAAAPVNVLPPTLGHKTRIWKQDPTVDIGIRNVYVHTAIHAGPKDSQIEIVGLPTVVPDVNGDFLFQPSSEDAFDAVHTYTVVRQTLTMYQRALNERIGWQWNTGGNSDPILVRPHAGESANAFYSRNGRSLEFFFFRPDDAPPNSPFVHTCRSFDIVAHELGHAVLDSLKPGWLTSSAPQTGGLHESFGDITSILLVLSQLDQVEYIIAQTKADLHQKNILSDVAEQFGAELLNRPNGLRNADNNLTLDEVSNQVHDISQVFTGGFYDVLADAFTAARDPRNVDDAIVLHSVGKKMATLFLKAIKASPASNATFSDVANEMIDVAQSSPDEFPNYDVFVHKHFSERKVLGNNAVAGPVASPGFAPSVARCCGTMQLT